MKLLICLTKYTLQKQKLALVSWIDLQKAFDRGDTCQTDKERHCQQHVQLDQVLHLQPQGRVSVDRVYRKKILLRHGVPQGELLSLTLFLPFITNLASELPKGIKATLYADDLVMWCKEECLTTAMYRMQLAADKPNSWTLKVKSTKTSLHRLVHPVLKTKSRHHHSWWNPAEATYLDVTFDKRHIWKPHNA